MLNNATISRNVTNPDGFSFALHLLIYFHLYKYGRVRSRPGIATEETITYFDEFQRFQLFSFAIHCFNFNFYSEFVSYLYRQNFNHGYYSIGVFLIHLLISISIFNINPIIFLCFIWNPHFFIYLYLRNMQHTRYSNYAFLIHLWNLTSVM